MLISTLLVKVVGMVTIWFTSALRRFLPTPSAEVEAATVGEALARVFATQPALRGYVLDDQGVLRRHVAIYLNGEPVRDRWHLTDPVGPAADIYVFQALSGG
ncbi:MAG TPA: MoaD/ThiS family protein [Stellaceae bacterium]|jgi:sulfur carrier protein ThiS